MVEYRTVQMDVLVEIQNGQSYSKVILPNQGEIFIENYLLSIFFEKTKPKQESVFERNIWANNGLK